MTTISLEPLFTEFEVNNNRWLTSNNHFSLEPLFRELVVNAVISSVMVYTFRVVQKPS
jgi:hypothetical protein